MNMKKINVIILALIILCLGVGSFSLYKIYSERQLVKDAEAQAAAFEQYSPVSDFDGSESYEEIYAKFKGSLESMQAVNSDIIGWLYIPYTNISYPLLQGSDNEYYLTHCATGAYSAAGAVFVDKRGMDTENTVIYGHNMGRASDIMFHDITNFSDKAWFDKVTKGYIITNDTILELNIFAFSMTKPQTAFYGDTADFDFIKTNAKYYREPVEGKLFTLSTCAYDYNDARAVLNAIAVEML